MESGRLKAFSDGVFAVAITLLALNLAIGGPGPHQTTLAAKLADHWPAFAAYAVSFATVGIIWVNHHALFRNISEIDRMLLFVNLLLLFFVVSIPFATATIAAYLRAGTGDASLAAALYLGVLEGMSICFTLMFWWAIRHDHLKAALSARDARQATIRFGLGSLVYIVRCRGALRDHQSPRQPGPACHLHSRRLPRGRRQKIHTGWQFHLAATAARWTALVTAGQRLLRQLRCATSACARTAVGCGPHHAQPDGEHDAEPTILHRKRCLLPTNELAAFAARSPFAGT